MTGYYKVWIRTKTPYMGEISPARLSHAADGYVVQSWVWPYYDRPSEHAAYRAARNSLFALTSTAERRGIVNIRSVDGDCILL